MGSVYALDQTALVLVPVGVYEVLSARTDRAADAVRAPHATDQGWSITMRIDQQAHRSLERFRRLVLTHDRRRKQREQAEPWIDLGGESGGA